MIVEQFVPALHDGDAIGNSTLAFHRFLRKKGIESRIVSLTIDEALRDQAVFFRDYSPRADSLKILHFAVPSTLTDFFIQTGGKKALIYHNITPSRFFADFSDDLVRITAAGREELKKLGRSFNLSIADSEFNAGELRELDFGRVVSFPIMIDLKGYEAESSRPFSDLFRDERRNILFVGRVTPNKKIEDLIKILFFYKKYISPSIRLIVAGNARTLPKYFLALRDLASRFHLTSDDIVFTGHLPFDELLALYRLADLFVSMSEHEGFCLPLIESCLFSVPVLAYAAGAVPETLDGAGVLVAEKRIGDIAGLAEQMMSDEKMRKTLKKLEAERIKRYKRESDPKLLLDLLKNL